MRRFEPEKKSQIMNTKMYVGNLPFSITEEELRELFEPFGEVSEAALVMDRETGRPRGFAFVSMATREAMESAIEGLNGQEVGGRALVVNEAKPREDRPNRGGGGGGYRGGGGGGGYKGGGGGGYKGGGGGGHKGGGGGRRRNDW